MKLVLVTFEGSAPQEDLSAGASTTVMPPDDVPSGIRLVQRAPEADDFERGASLLHGDDVMTARPFLERAAARHRDDAEAQLYAAWARARAAASPSAGRDRREAVSLARRALADGRATSLALCVLGYASLDRGDLRVARVLFRRAAAADETLVDARRQLLLVNRRLEQASDKRPRRGRAQRLVSDIVMKITGAPTAGRLTR